jgi:hypothetical protein
VQVPSLQVVGLERDLARPVAEGAQRQAPVLVVDLDDLAGRTNWLTAASSLART